MDTEEPLRLARSKNAVVNTAWHDHLRTNPPNKQQFNNLRTGPSSWHAMNTEEIVIGEQRRQIQEPEAKFQLLLEANF